MKAILIPKFGLVTVLFLAVLAVFQVSNAIVFEPDYSRMHPGAIARMEQLADGNYDLRTEIPDRMRAGQNGYVIITTKARRDALKALPAFVNHKRSRGFDVSVITEDQFGGGTGVAAALNIRRWLQANYKDRSLLYVLMLGNPHPEKGDIPFKKVGATKHHIRGIVEAGSITQYAQQNPDFKDIEGYVPTDYFYVDLDSDWDINKNGLYADYDDYGEGGINGQWEVLVGRIPYYDFDGFSGTEHVNRQLERIIRYENERGDLSWRHNMFYNGGVFNRDLSYFDDAMRFNGAFLFRQTFHGSGLLYEPENPFGHLSHQYTAEKLNTVNDSRFGMAYFQGHGIRKAGGGMSSGAAALLDDTYPKVFASGACDVGAPEIPDNMMNALLVHAGVAAYGGTRSVTGCTGNSWLRHQNYYPYFYFGNSTGETLWRARSFQSKENKIGFTNFMINLYGDPSIVPMPQVFGPEVGISPGWKTAIRTNVGKQASYELPYEIRNNSTRRQSYRVEAHKVLQGVPTQFSLNPGEVKAFTVTLQGIEFAKPGEYELPIHVTASNGKTNEAGVMLKIEPQKILVYEPFSKPVVTTVDVTNNGQTTKQPVQASEVLAPGVFGASMLVNDHAYQPHLGFWASRSDFTVSFFVRFKSLEGAYELVNCGPFRVAHENGKLVCYFNTNRWTIERKQQQIAGPVFGEDWNFVSISVDRSSQKVSMTVNDEQLIEGFNISLADNMDLSNMTIPATKGASMFLIDELTAHNYVLSDIDRKALRYHYVAKPRAPRYGSEVNNSEVAFLWESAGDKRTFEFELSDNPDFSGAITRELTEQRTIVRNLKDGESYYWRVSFLTPSGVRLEGQSTKFTASSKVERINLKLRNGVRLPEAVAGVAGYSQTLRKMVAGISEKQWDDTAFTKLSGPRWLEVHTDGTLFTNYGAPESAVGKNEFIAEVIAPDGQSMQIEFAVEVRPASGAEVTRR